MSTKFCNVCKIEIAAKNFARHEKTQKHLNNVRNDKNKKKVKQPNKVIREEEKKQELSINEKLRIKREELEKLNKEVLALEFQMLENTEIKVKKEKKQKKNEDSKILITNDTYDLEKIKLTEDRETRIGMKKEAKIIKQEVEEFLMNSNKLKWHSYDNSKKKLFMKEIIEAETIDELKTKLNMLFYKYNKKCFKVNLILSAFIMTGKKLEKDLTRKEYLREKYGIVDPGRNLALFHHKNKNIDGFPCSVPTIKNKKDFDKDFIKHVTIKKLNLVLDRIARPDSSYQTIGVPKFIVEITPSNQKMGAIVELPNDILDSRLIMSMSNVKNNMCFFHCIARALDPELRRDRMNTPAKELLRKMYKNEKMTSKGFKGVRLDEINDFQQVIEANINIYEYGDNLKDINPLIVSDCVFEKRIDLLKYENHLMLILNRDTLLGRYQCEVCKRFFHSTRGYRSP